MKRAHNFKDFSGQRFGRLTVKSLAGRLYGKVILWLCVCDCGNTVTTRRNNLVSGNSTSCGCFKNENLRAVNTIHGATVNHRPTDEYRTWILMKRRCYNPKDSSYSMYGGRGIYVCQRWINSFEAFFKDMGLRPGGLTLDRIDVNGNYEPSNCRWATWTTQQNNRRDNVFIEYGGKRMTVSQWNVCLNLGRGQLASRLYDGWTIERAIETPRNKRSNLQPV